MISINNLIGRHSLIVGRTGTGKTRLLMSIIRNLIMARLPVICIDGKGELYRDTQSFIAALRVKPEGRVTLIDPQDNYAPGLNLFQSPVGAHPTAQIGLIIDLFSKFLKQEEDAHVLLREHGTACFVPLALSGLTLADASTFLDVIDPSFRHAVLAQLQKPAFEKKWRDLEKTFRVSEQAHILLSVKTRVDTVMRTPYLAALFGQRETTIDWNRHFFKDGLLLGNLGTSAQASLEATRFIGVSLLSLINQYARIRPDRFYRPLFVIVDEFQKFLTDDLADSLNQLRSFGVYFILASQSVSQIEQRQPAIFNSVMDNCTLKVIFNVSRRDSEILWPEIFAGEIAHEFKTIKDEIWATRYEPVEEARIVETEGESLSESVTWNESQSYTKTEGEGESHSDTYSFSETESGSEALSESESACLENEAIQKSKGVTITKGGNSGSSSGTSDTYSTQSSRSQGESESEGGASGRTKSKTRAKVPFIAHRPYQELSSRTYLSEPEIREKFIEKIMKQPKRHFIFKIDDKPAGFKTTPFVQAIHMRPQSLDDYKQRVYDATGRPIEEVISEIEQRPQQYKNRDEGNEPDITQPRRKR